MATYKKRVPPKRVMKETVPDMPNEVKGEPRLVGGQWQAIRENGQYFHKGVRMDLTCVVNGEGDLEVVGTHIYDNSFLPEDYAQSVYDTKYAGEKIEYGTAGFTNQGSSAPKGEWGIKDVTYKEGDMVVDVKKNVTWVAVAQEIMEDAMPSLSKGKAYPPADKMWFDTGAYLTSETYGTIPTIGIEHTPSSWRSKVMGQRAISYYPETAGSWKEYYEQNQVKNPDESFEQ